jgi:hypothetical protein
MGGIDFIRVDAEAAVAEEQAVGGDSNFRVAKRQEIGHQAGHGAQQHGADEHPPYWAGVNGDDEQDC